MGIDIFTLEKSDAKWAARKLDDNEMAEHDAFIASCTDALRGVSGASLANLQPKKIFVSLNLDYLAYWSR